MIAVLDPVLAPPARFFVPVDYPSSDREPMADSDQQYDAMTDTKFALVNYFRDEPLVYVAANLLIYYKEGDPKKRIAPDVFVAHGVVKGKRSSYKVWNEGQVPQVVFEVASPGTWRKDKKNTKLYHQLGVKEYIMLDPFGGRYFDEALVAYRYTKNGYQPLPYLPTTVDGELGVFSTELRLEIWAKPTGLADEPYIFRFRDPQTGEWLLSQEEEYEAHLQAEEKAKAEAFARRQAEKKAVVEASARRQAEKKAVIEASARRQAEQKAKLAEEKRKAEAEARRQAEEELARLKAQLALLTGQSSSDIAIIQ